ncbi:MAG: UDP-3-O-[3-hydroxymyristoyl] N-acetylglucosamine deacetylase [Planctomycetales bacterium]|nr:UDP-3-O-[3-hydroxymyristoyl] N-acetylglucosamine deacetylase [Planctomycetales bacterium]
MLHSRLQQTIQRPAVVSGVGFWSGKEIRVEFRPAPEGTGIRFVRDDIGPQASIPALVEYRADMPRRTNLCHNGTTVEMVEHVLAALAGLQIDNCEVGVDQAEMPGCDGSAQEFVAALDAAGIETQPAEVSRLEITHPIRIESGETWIEARPTLGGEYSVEFELDYPQDPIIGLQSTALEVTPENFRREVAPCRTFVLQREAEQLVRLGLGSHVSPHDLLVFDEHGPIENELRFGNECARHKALDVIGDMALTGHAIVGQIIAHRSGHKLHAALAQELLTHFQAAAPLRASA